MRKRRGRILLKKAPPPKPRCKEIIELTLQNVNVRERDRNRDEAEAKLYDEILKQCEKDRNDQGVPQCSEGVCKNGRICMPFFEIVQNSVRSYRYRRVGFPSVWVYSYRGIVTHYCRCVEVLPPPDDH